MRCTPSLNLIEFKSVKITLIIFLLKDTLISDVHYTFQTQNKKVYINFSSMMFKVSPGKFKKPGCGAVKFLYQPKIDLVKMKGSDSEKTNCMCCTIVHLHTM